ncbi:MAG: hypothetical protein QNJ22_07565 [Desulfosarcinaceae bacterium]|nr:hypothetical protein [Desulfosarcinaceae bacterium]
MVELKTITAEAVPGALEMAKRYRLLNEPHEAESICLDILAVDGDHQEALITLLLALTDKFDQDGLKPAYEEALKVVERLSDAYCKSYYGGIVFERRAKYHLKQEGPGSGAVAYDWFTKALKAYGEALSSCDPNNQDAVLRWNSCARIINTHPEVKEFEADHSEMLLDAFDTPH